MICPLNEFRDIFEDRLNIRAFDSQDHKHKNKMFVLLDGNLLSSKNIGIHFYVDLLILRNRCLHLRLLILWFSFFWKDLIRPFFPFLLNSFFKIYFLVIIFIL